MHEQLEGRLEALRAAPSPPPAAFLASVRRRRRALSRARVGIATMLSALAVAATARLWLRPPPASEGSPGLMARVAHANADDLASSCLLGRFGSGLEARPGSLDPTDVFRAGDGLWTRPEAIDGLLEGV